jgi:heat shock protein HtpX
MAIERRIPADRGLTFRMLTTAFFIGLLYVVVVGVLFAVGISSILIIVIAGALFIAQFFFSDKIALFSMGGRIVTPDQAPELHAVVDRLCALADMPKPQVAIANTDIPNAFATGRSQKHAVVCATTGILRRLDEPELEAVLAHEISHVAHRDVMVMTIASFLGILAGLITRVFFYMGLFGGFGGGGGGRGGRNGQNIVMIELGIMLFSMIIYAISFMLTMALSRYRELAADRSGAILIGRPSLLASALVKVSGEMARIPTRDIRSAEHFNAFFFSPVSSRGFSVSSLFATHPPLQKRLDQLNKLEAEMDKG